jgi:hypothetical protein
MAEGLATPDGTTLNVAPAGEASQEWATAMAAPGPDSVQAPPKKDPDAPYGRTKDGTPKKGPGGRPSKADRAEQSRTAPAAAVLAPASAEEFEQPLGELADSVWLLLAMTPPTQAQAALWRAHAPAVVHGFALGAAQNPAIRAGVRWLTAESWMVVLAMAVVPFALQSVALWTAPDRLGVTPADLQAATVRELQTMRAQQEAAFRAAAGVDQAAA